MPQYRFEENGYYQVVKTLTPWRPQHSVIVSWIKPNSKVLDVACGDGVLGEMLIKQRNCRVYGTDLDPVAVKEARRRGIKALVHDADTRLPFKSQSFDFTVCNEALEFINNPDLTVSELLRVGKTAIIEFPNFGFWFYRLQLLLGHFPNLSLFGYTWWNTHQTKFFSYADFLKLPSLSHAKIHQTVCINWRNRKISQLSKLSPNLFGRSCILEISSSKA